MDRNGIFQFWGKLGKSYFEQNGDEFHILEKVPRKPKIKEKTG